MEALFRMRKLKTKALPPKTNKLIKLFQQKRLGFLTDFYLSGGTALSLQLGHRESIDLDFFNQEDFDPRLIQQELEKIGKLEDIQLDKNTLNAFLKGVKVQFLGYPYPLLESTDNWKGIRISSIVDIACTKLHTISMRGSKKDFVDLYFVLKRYKLKELFTKLKKKYPKTDYNKAHILKSLVYFDTADGQPMPRMHKKANWAEVKETIKNKVKNYEIVN